MDNQDLINTLNKLVETCKDGEYGFQSCAEHVESLSLRQTFAQRANECRQAGSELQMMVKAIGGKAEDGGTASGAVHRGWVAVKGALSGYSDLAMLEECERGEDAALGRYRKAMEKDLPVDVRALVKRHLDGAQRTHDQIRALRDRARLAEV